MSTRWMAVQYVGDTLRLPVVNEGDMDKPFGSSVLERDVKRIVVNPFSDSPQTFVPELESAELRELLRKVEHYERMGCYECPYADGCDAGTLYDENCAMSREIERKKRELGIEVDA